MDVSSGHSTVPYLISWMYFSPGAFGQYWESDGKTTFQIRQSAHGVSLPMSLAQLVRLWRLGWTGHVQVLHHNDLIFTSRLQRTWTTSNSWWQTWLVTSVSSATSPLRTNQCHCTETNSTAQAHRSSDKLVTLAISSVPAAPSRTSPPAGTRSISASTTRPIRAEVKRFIQWPWL